jgi:hypothetical protein
MRFFTSAFAWIRSLPRRVRGYFGSGGGTPTDILDSPLLALGPHDTLSWRDAFEGVFVAGATGSGKSSASAASFLRAFFSLNWGGLLTTAKGSDRRDYENYARETERSGDLLIFGPGSPHRFNFLTYEMMRPGTGAGLLENIVNLFMQAMEVAGERHDGGHDPYWARATKQLLRNALHLALLGLGEVRVADLLAIVRSGPRNLEEVRAEESPWRRESFCFQTLLAASRKLTTEAERLDYDQMEAYWLLEFAGLVETTRSIIVQNFVSLADVFTRSPLRELFCTDTTFTPEDAQRGKIILLDLPVKEWGEVGRIAQVLFKVCFQRCTERRDLTKNPVPVFLLCDEAQLFFVSSDESFLQTARSSRACTVYLTQNLPNVYSALGGHQKAQHQADSILGNLSTHIYHCNGDAVTNEYAARRIAQIWQLKTGANQGYSSNMSQSGGSLNADTATTANYSDNSGTSVSEQLAYQVLPQEFSVLRTGGPHNNLLVDGIIHKPGRFWRATGANYMRVTFKQR